MTGGTTLVGVVRDEHGPPIPAFTVGVQWKRGPLEFVAHEQATFMDPDGAFAVRGLRPGEYLVRVLAAGFVAGEQHMVIPEDDDIETVRVVFQLERGGTVTGRVVTQGTNHPIVGARVAVEETAEGGSLTPSFHSLTNHAGVFAIEGIAASGVSLLVSASGHNSRVVQAVRPGTHELVLTPVSQDAGPHIELVGIGAVLKPRGDALVVGQVVPDGGAALAGIEPSDEIVQLDGRPVVEIGWPQAIDVIRGAPGTTIVVGIRKRGEGPVNSVTVTRAKVGA